MHDNARTLGAEVQGDEGEVYEELELSAPVIDPTVVSKVAGFWPWFIPMMSFIPPISMTVLALVMTLVRKEYPAGTPIPMFWATLLVCSIGLGCLSWISSVLLAICWLARRLSPAWIAWQTIALNAGSVTVFVWLVNQPWFK